MHILLDTHVLIWLLMEPGRLDLETRDVIEARPNEILFSAVSAWEIAIKTRLNRPGFTFHPDEIRQAALDTGFRELLLNSSAASHLLDLPLRHRDPFDHILIAQAISEPALFYTADTQLTAYSELVRLIRPR
jgi:PIN domain nuclease of toxin-antitoxin system